MFQSPLVQRAMSAGKVLALLVVVVFVAMAAVVVSWCCWCIRSRYGDKNIQAVKSAATVADTLESSSRGKSSVSTFPAVNAAAAATTAAAPEASRLAEHEPKLLNPAVEEPGYEIFPRRTAAVVDEDTSALEEGVAGGLYDHSQTPLLGDYQKELAREPLVAQNLYQRKSSNMDLFSRENSMLTLSSAGTPTRVDEAKSHDEDTTDLNMSKIMYRKKSKFDLFSRENTLMSSDSPASVSVVSGNLKADLQEEPLTDSKRDVISMSITDREFEVPRDITSSIRDTTSPGLLSIPDERLPFASSEPTTFTTQAPTVASEKRKLSHGIAKAEDGPSEDPKRRLSMKNEGRLVKSPADTSSQEAVIHQRHQDATSVPAGLAPFSKVGTYPKAGSENSDLRGVPQVPPPSGKLEGGLQHSSGSSLPPKKEDDPLARAVLNMPHILAQTSKQDISLSSGQVPSCPPREKRKKSSA